MSFSIFPFMALLALVCMTYAQEYMGPASFAWPLPRAWNRTLDNNPPCGFSDIGTRSKFPMYNGYVAFVSQYETRNLEVKVSYMWNPKSVADFVPLTPRRFRKYGVGYACIKVPDAPSDIDPGANATFQLRFASDYDSPSHRSFFVCADITYVEPDDIDYPFPCINTTDLELEPLPPAKKKKPEEPKPIGDEWSPGEKKTGLSKGAIAGIAIGCAVAASGIAVFITHQMRKYRERETQDMVPCTWVPGSYGLPDAVPVEGVFFSRPTRRD
ncbi:uncharacterized protein TrAFT101_008601 [Trichoderma asperellum]|uniref:Copper acquisition factor BIM1-like domain-containing protein n=1 Tax=Trichoderma asperellum (strain ATCC 204424 / CBS 433.97 / NBRC 101777) TaxID=1042311 RepID=A0A2T3ZBX9_TRIA4|nr:hypothetical protein M441DRAFT_190876 [Trichoderma asperellum CBS 433.97]PTB42309.1 hypothetical protein M441DRAFT_190876 [Trichoderma asperellum CBS 433.97]UKZ93693.1 hypothetical protein TrAFT101_008601 [Trichoderma asperellum]